DLYATLQPFRFHHVVVRRPLEVGASSLMDGEIVIGSGAEVLLLPEVADPMVALGEAAADLLSSVRGGVVGDDQLEIVECLLEDRLDRLIQELGAVVHGHSDGHSWTWLVLTHMSPPKHSFQKRTSSPPSASAEYRLIADSYPW